MRLNGHLGVRCKTKGVHCRGEDARQLRRIESGRRPATEIDRAQRARIERGGVGVQMQFRQQ